MVDYRSEPSRRNYQSLILKKLYKRNKKHMNIHIKKAELIHIKIPMKFTFTTGFGSISERETLIIKLTSKDGLVGYGESAALAAPIYLSETIQTCIHVLKDFLIPQLLNRSLTLEEYMEEIRYIRGHQIAKHGVECALWMIQSLQTQQSLSQLLGGTQKTIDLGESIGMMDSVENTVSLVTKRIHEGYRRIKLKIHPGKDIELIKAVRQMHPTIPLMVDANSSYTLKDIGHLKKLDVYHLMMIEQPLAHDDIIDHAKLQKKLETPICLDESICSAEDARKAIEIGACRIINVKPGRVGGLIESLKIHALAKKYHIPLWCGGMLESGIGKAYNIAIASLSSFTLPADISPSALFYKKDITDEIILSGHGTTPVPNTPGLGYAVYKNQISKYHVKTISL